MDKKTALIQELNNWRELSPVELNIATKLPMTKIKKLIEFAKKGYNLDIFFRFTKTKTGDTPFRLVQRYGDMSKYPFVSKMKVGCNYDKCLNELEELLIRGLDTFMYEVYAHEIDECVRTTLYNLLREGRNHTRDFDYRKVTQKEQCSYLNAVTIGIPKDVAYHIMRHFQIHLHLRVYDLYRTGVDMKSIIDMKNRYSVTDDSIVKLVEICKRFKLDMTKYIEVATSRRTDMYQYLLVVKWTHERFIPDINSKFSPYMQYLISLGIPEQDLLESITYRNNQGEVRVYPYNHTEALIRFNLLEVCYYKGEDWRNYSSLLKRLDNLALKCIACGVDVISYFNLGIDQTLTEIFSSAINGADLSIIRKCLGFSLTKSTF